MRRSVFVRRPRPDHMLLFVFGLFLLFGGALFVAASWWDYEHSLERARDKSEGTAFLLAENMQRTVETSDILMREAMALIAEKGVTTLRRSRSEWEKLRDLAKAQREAASIWVFDAAGNAVLTSSQFGKPDPPISIADEALFRRQRETAEDGLMIGPTMIGRRSGRPMLPISRRIVSPDGGFGGIIVSAIEIAKFTDFYGTLAFGPNSTLAVLGENGEVFLRQPARAHRVGANIHDSELFTVHLPQAAAGSYETRSPFDGVPRITSYRKVDDLPLVVVASIARDEALAEWRSRLRWNGLMATASLAAAALLVWPTLQAMRRHEAWVEALREAHRRNVEILESISDAFFHVDQAWRFTYVNATAERIWGKRRDSLIGKNFWAAFPDVIGSEAHRRYLHAAETREASDFETFSTVLRHWIEVSIFPSRTGMSVYFRDISERKRAERQQRLLMAELSHRVKNTLAVVLSIAGQTHRRSSSIEEFSASFKGRILALANAHSLLTASRWEEAKIDALVQQAMNPYVRADGSKCRIDGPEISLRPKAALTLALVLHELATNATKYGALSRPAGRVDVRWRREQRPEGIWVRLTWGESGGPAVSQPTRRGFGSLLIERSIAYELGGEARLTFQAGGVQCEIALPAAEDANPSEMLLTG